MDIYKRHLNPDAEQKRIVKVGRFATAGFVVAGCLLAPLPAQFSGVFEYIQMIWGFISPGIVAVFFFGLVFRRAPQTAAVAAMISGIPVYGLLLWLLPDVAFLNHMAFTFVILISVMAFITWRTPLAEPVRFATKTEINLEVSKWAKKLGALVVLLTIILYIYFW